LTSFLLTFFLFDIAAAAANNLFIWLKNFTGIWRNVSQTRCFASVLHMLLQALQLLKHLPHQTFFITSHLWSGRTTMTLLHWRQQRWVSAIKGPQEWGVNSVAVTKKRMRSAEVWGKSTTSDNKDKATATATQAHFAEVTDALDEAMHFSQPWASLWAWPWSQCQYCTQKMHMKLTEVIIEVWLW